MVAKAAEQSGYSLFQGSWPTAVRSINSFPAVWLAPPALKSVEGRARGVMCYKISMRLMKTVSGLHAEDCSPVMESLQQDAMEIIDELREQTAVCDITGIKCTPNAEPSTAAREISMSVEMDLHAYFNKIES